MNRRNLRRGNALRHDRPSRPSRRFHHFEGFWGAVVKARSEQPRRQRAARPASAAASSNCRSSNTFQSPGKGYQWSVVSSNSKFAILNQKSQPRTVKNPPKHENIRNTSSIHYTTRQGGLVVAPNPNNSHNCYTHLPLGRQKPSHVSPVSSPNKAEYPPLRPPVIRKRDLTDPISFLLQSSNFKTTTPDPCSPADPFSPASNLATVRMQQPS